jgi:hypothetical protein
MTLLYWSPDQYFFILLATGELLQSAGVGRVYPDYAYEQQTVSPPIIRDGGAHIRRPVWERDWMNFPSWDPFSRRQQKSPSGPYQLAFRR